MQPPAPPPPPAAARGATPSGPGALYDTVMREIEAARRGQPRWTRRCAWSAPCRGGCARCSRTWRSH